MKINKLFAFGIALTVLLLCAPTAYAQDVVVPKPTLPTKPTPTPIPIPIPEPTPNPTPTPKPTPTTGYINGHEWVDLGLSVKWATCNVGASSPSDYGDYYAWSETTTKSSYTSDNSVTYGKDMGSIAGNSTYDAARANWGGTWRLPTKAEIDELINKCKREWTTQGGHRGYKVTGPNGNSIFLPAAGFRGGTSLRATEVFGFYWSATPYEDDTNDAYSLFYCTSRAFSRHWYNRYSGQSVRPVSE